MSGLVPFFRDFLPDFDYNEHTEESDDLYEQSLESLRPVVGYDTNPNSAVLPSTLTLEHTDPWTLQDLREFQKQSIENYFYRRIGSSEDLSDSEDEYSSSSEEEEEEDNEEEDEQPLETQQPMIPEEASKQQASRPDPPARRHTRRIPHISQAIYSNVEYMDMLTSELELDDCKLTKVWRFRETKRGIQNESRYEIPIIPGRLPRLAIPHRDDDGPVSSIYHHVISLELKTLTSRRLYVFLYNAYAQAFDQWFHGEQRQGKGQIVVQMKQVPGICIFPFAIDPRNWLDAEELVEYCLCIGDESSAKRYNEEQGDYERLRLDQPKMELRFFQKDKARQRNRAATEELVLSTDTIDGLKPLRKKASFNVQIPSPPPSPQQEEEVEAEPILEEDDDDDEDDVEDKENSAQTRPLPVEMPKRKQPLGEMDFVGDAKRLKKGDETVHYIKLNELQNALNLQEQNSTIEFNLYATVLVFTCARQTRRGHWMVSATLVDDTVNESPVTAIFFCSEKRYLPALVRAGDVLRMHNVHLDFYKGDVQIQGRGFSSYVVIRQNEANDWSVVPSETQSFVFSIEDAVRAQHLWLWAKCFLEQYPLIKPQHRFTIANLAVEGAIDGRVSDRDLTVMVSAIFPNPEETQNSHTPCGFLRVWDGTGDGPNDPLPIQSVLAKNTQREGDPPPEALMKISEILEKLDLSNEMETPKALCGKVTNIYIWEQTFWDFVTKNVKIGTFIRLRNVDARRWKENDFPTFMVHDKSWLSPLPDEAFEVRSLLEAHSSRMLVHEYNPNSGLLPLPRAAITRIEEGRQGNLSSSLALYTSNPIGFHVCIVNLVDTIPAYDSSLRPFCKLRPDGTTFVYCFAVTIADLSTKVDVIVNDSVGAKIIGMPAGMAIGTARKRGNQIVDPDAEWVVKLMTLTVNGEIFHILVDISGDV